MSADAQSWLESYIGGVAFVAHLIQQEETGVAAGNRHMRDFAERVAADCLISNLRCGVALDGRYEAFLDGFGGKLL